MKILVDENIPLMTVRTLQSASHDVRDIRGTNEQGLRDDLLWQTAQQGQRLLITTDKGFTQYREEPHYGILIGRLRQPNRKKLHERVMKVMAEYEAHQWQGLTIVRYRNDSNRFYESATTTQGSLSATVSLRSATRCLHDSRASQQSPADSKTP